MDAGRFFFWLLVGALLGAGFVGVLSIGILLLVPAVALIAIGAIRLGARRMWAVLIGFGAVPALLLALDILTAPPRCPANGIRLPPGAHTFSCSGPLDNYVQLAFVFGGIALLGVLWPLVVRWVRRAGARGR